MSIWVYRGISHEPYHVWSDSVCTFCKSQMELLHRQIDDISTLKSHGAHEKHVFVCPICGWWKADGQRRIDNWVHHAVFSTREGAAASLRELDLTNIRTPIQEVRSYLSAKYENRFTLNPRLFEQTIASVFGDLGYAAEATAYSGDDGIDVIFRRGDETIGVQTISKSSRFDHLPVHSCSLVLLAACS